MRFHRVASKLESMTKSGSPSPSERVSKGDPVVGQAICPLCDPLLSENHAETVGFVRRPTEIGRLSRVRNLLSRFV